MATRKTPFEVVHARPNARQRTQVPKWWRSISVNVGTAKSPAGAPVSGSRTRKWFGRPVDIRLTRGILAGCAFVLLAALVAAYLLGAVREARTKADQRSTDAMTQLGRQPINPQLMRTEDGQPTVETVTSGPIAPPAYQPTDGDPRIPGMYYYCIATTPTRYESEAQRAVEFLRRNGVDAAVLPVNNRQIQIVALKGFARPNSPDAQDYEKLLRALGRMWKAEHSGFSDWSDLYAPKYTGSRPTDD